MGIFNHRKFHKYSKCTNTFIAYSLIVFISLIDSFISPDMSTMIFYLIPIAFMAYASSTLGLIWISITAAICWSLADIMSGEKFINYIFFWNAIAHFAIFILVAKLIRISVKKTKYYEKLAYQDELTGLLNRRGFLEKANEELNRSKRFKREFSLAFIDLDNFKMVNDNQGHKAGDTLLKAIADCMKSNVRVIDHVGRLGGDEFAILFVETNQEKAKFAFENIRKKLDILFKSNDWPVSISASIVTDTKESNFMVSELLEQADAWMYTVKQSSKDGVIYKLDTEYLGDI